MDVKDIVDNIPSIEKVLGATWIICWFLSIWFYHIQFFLSGLFCLFLLLIVLGVFDTSSEEKNKPPLVLSMDKTQKALVVQRIYEEDLEWDENEVCSGEAKLPQGLIKEGDRVTNCEGNVALRHVPSNTLIGGFNFED
ncbi:MAG: hypothetical protein V5A64_03695 [Candidatus Thermoplasmatota archaeon]